MTWISTKFGPHYYIMLNIEEIQKGHNLIIASNVNVGQNKSLHVSISSSL